MYFSFIAKSFKKMFVYRLNSCINIFSSIIKLFIQICLWTALISASATSEMITLKDMLTFVFINTFVLSFTQTNMGNLLGVKVKDGTIAIDLLRPVNLKLYLFAEEFGENLYRTVFNVLPVCISFLIFYNIYIPSDYFTIILFFISIINGIVLIYYINYIFGLTSFWLKESWYIVFYQSAMFFLFGGVIVPLWFYPKSLLSIADLLPFKYVSFQPITIYLNNISFEESIRVILLQFMWILILYLLSKIIWKRAKKKVIIQGG